jgi:hypothetical protein
LLVTVTRQKRIYTDGKELIKMPDTIQLYRGLTWETLPTGSQRTMIDSQKFIEEFDKWLDYVKRKHGERSVQYWQARADRDFIMGLLDSSSSAAGLLAQPVYTPLD